MAATLFEVDHKCGHTQDHDLSHKAAGERAGYVAWLEKQACTDCWKKSAKRKVSKELAAERASRMDDAYADQERSNLPVLRGSEKQVEWATRLRYEKLHDIYVERVESGALDEDAFDTDVLEPARMIGTAKFWIDNRDAADDALLELLADPGEVHLLDNENPY